MPAAVKEGWTSPHPTTREPVHVVTQEYAKGLEDALAEIGRLALEGGIRNVDDACKRLGQIFTVVEGTQVGSRFAGVCPTCPKNP